MADPDLELRGRGGSFDMLKQNWFANIACSAGFSSFCIFSLFFYYFFFAKIRGQGPGPPRAPPLDPPLTSTKWDAHSMKLTNPLFTFDSNSECLSGTQRYCFRRELENVSLSFQRQCYQGEIKKLCTTLEQVWLTCCILSIIITIIIMLIIIVKYFSCSMLKQLQLAQKTGNC